MMKKLLLPLIALCLTPFLSAFIFTPPPPIWHTTSSGCSQSATFLARTSGLSGTQTTAYQNLICGMVTDGTWSLFDALYVFATNTTTTANLNLVSTSYGLTQSGTVTFSANAGYAGNGSTGYLNTSYTPSTNGVNFTLNSATMGLCSFTNSSATSYDFGSANGSNYDLLALNYGGFVVYVPINGAPATLSASTSLGSWVSSRTGSTTTTVYNNGASYGTHPAASTAASTYPLYIGAGNITGVVTSYSTKQYGYAFVAGGLTSTQASNIYSRLHTYLSAVSAPTGC